MSDMNITKSENSGDCSNCQMHFELNAKNRRHLFHLWISAQDQVLCGLY